MHKIDGAENIGAKMEIDNFLSALIGAALAWGTQWFFNKRQRDQQGKIATMLAATGLRAWLNDCVVVVTSLNNWLSTNGEMGSGNDTIPSFPFEKSLEQVALLPPADSKAIFDLMHDCRKAQHRQTAFDYEDEQEDEVIAHSGEVAELFDRGRKIYERLTENLGWDASFSEWQLSSIQRSASRYSEAKAEKEAAEIKLS